ncbi:uncharacterized protein F5Z01DRAFT_663398 [Emericellopsis atlantica]|uniref:Uncharacterized protein n=1 Tax=Emericellopsis atlantica TaxID=2614577 RepID=A0A9P7ZH62_9HYPO|nr:uncharacterized protein F5Z01DRAFT_663398 [Emericellopsis atlantica]KAG9251388.1 hypothetical protein F5Z01DRAFT_663398 [Emericellopsis atlantica]
MSSHRISKAARDLIRLLESGQMNTLTDLCRLERTAVAVEEEVDSKALQEPVTAAWRYYVNSNQFLIELRRLTPTFPFSGELVAEAYRRVMNDPETRTRSWNQAWLLLVKMKEDGLLMGYASTEAHKQEMWGDMIPSPEQLASLATDVERAWSRAVEIMLRNWPIAPTYSYSAHWRGLPPS